MVHTQSFRVISMCVALTLWAFCATSLHAQIDFNRQIRPILAENCFQCHGPDAKQRGADLRLDVEQNAKSEALVPGNAEASPLIHRVLSTDPDQTMPPPSSGKILNDSQKELLRQWIKEGAPYARHWAFQPIQSSESLLARLPPSSKHESPIDRFLLAPLAQRNLTYAPEVTKAQLIRRATFDLTGLPPTWPDVENFLHDNREGSYERLIDRLLESPRYGERWGRHWLDIARYADTHGGAAIGFKTFPYAYTYRDYVIDAFNRDLPIDQFIVEQIAADQLDLPSDSPSLAAMGFLTVGMQFRNYHDTIDDQIDVITRGLMGLTVTCARCHDHKFDSIPTTDYYAFYATIAPSKAPSDLPEIASPSTEEARAKYEQQLRALSMKLKDFVRDQSEVMRHRLRMQVGLYLSEIAKGLPEQDLSTEFLSYRTDDIRPLIFNRWRSYLESLMKEDPVFAVWKEAEAWNDLAPEQFQEKCLSLVTRFSEELNSETKSPEKHHALRSEPPKWNPVVLQALLDRKPKTRTELAKVYGEVFSSTQSQWLQALVSAASEAAPEGKVIPDDHASHQVINSPTHRQLRHHLYASGTPTEVSDEEAMRLTNRTISDLINTKRGAIHELNLSSPGSPPRAMILREDPNPKPSYVFLRGNPLARGESVPARFLSAISPPQSPEFENGKRRLGLAKALIEDQNPLTARVLVNWVWQNHFGVGLVRTPDDFGTRGRSPTHPELLDYLADQFRKNGWSLKKLHREIMLSRAYRQGAIEQEAFRQTDPDNELLWRMPRRRLDFEAMRDSMLAVSEELDVTIGGRPIDLNASPAIPRRSVYGFVNRDIIANLMSTFDSANPNACTAKRPETTVPQQTLFALNSDFIQDRASRIASLVTKANLATDQEKIEAMVQRILGRTPNSQEVELAQRFLFEQISPASQQAGETTGNQDRWIQLAHALLASNEFMFLD